MSQPRMAPGKSAKSRARATRNLIAGRTRLALGLHAERLHDRAVWEAVSELLERFERRAGRVTIFCHPFWAMLEGGSLEEPLRRLEERGHEIAQHTHYYTRPRSGVPFVKHTDLSDENVRECLQEDFGYLKSLGYRPRGFTAGGWAISSAAFEWLARHGFDYDTTYRTYRLPYFSKQAVAGDACGGPFRVHGLLELPTTLPLARATVLKPGIWRTARAHGGEVAYTLAYLHDYDLIGAAKRIATRLLSLPGLTVEPVCEIVGSVQSARV